MRDRLIWFFGPSAAGKSTLIESVAATPSHPLRASLDLGVTVKVCRESLEIYDRDALAGMLEAHDTSNEVLLVKGQTTDITYRSLPQRLTDIWEQSTVFVWADLTVLEVRRAEREALYTLAGNIEAADYWRQHSCRRELYEYQIPLVKSLTLPITCVRTQGGTFDIGRCPPNML